LIIASLFHDITPYYNHSTDEQFLLHEQKRQLVLFICSSLKIRDSRSDHHGGNLLVH